MTSDGFTWTEPICRSANASSTNTLEDRSGVSSLDSGHWSMDVMLPRHACRAGIRGTLGCRVVWWRRDSLWCWRSVVTVSTKCQREMSSRTELLLSLVGSGSLSYLALVRPGVYNTVVLMRVCPRACVHGTACIRVCVALCAHMCAWHCFRVHEKHLIQQVCNLKL